MTNQSATHQRAWLGGRHRRQRRLRTLGDIPFPIVVVSLSRRPMSGVGSRSKTPVEAWTVRRRVYIDADCQKVVEGEAQVVMFISAKPWSPKRST